jgi:diguanylate cyclase (GGDEF)-like protein
MSISHPILDLATIRRLLRIIESDFETFFAEAGREAANIVRADGVALIGLNDSGWMQYRFFSGVPETYSDSSWNYQFPATSGLVGQAIAQGAPCFSADYANSPHAIQHFVDIGLKANLILPIGPAGQQEAVLALDWFNRTPEAEPGAAELEALHLITDMLQTAMTMQKMIGRWQHQALRDPLTGLPNRLALQDHLAQELARARRHDHAVAIGIIDLDDFKLVNDSYGHAAGDTVLKALGARLQTQMRKPDMLARIGGDEFVIVIEGLEPQGAEQQVQLVLNRMRQAVETPFHVPSGALVRIGMSIGLALFPRHGADGEALMRQADEALYRVKSERGGPGQWWRMSA